MPCLESAERYVRLYADERRVKVSFDSRLGPSEPFVIFGSKKYGIQNTAGYHLSYSQLNKLEGGRGEVIGRTEYGPFCELFVIHYRVVSVRILPDDDQEKIKKEVLEDW